MLKQKQIQLTEDQISKKAYEISQSSEGQQRDSDDNWFESIRQLRLENSAWFVEPIKKVFTLLQGLTVWIEKRQSNLLLIG